MPWLGFPDNPSTALGSPETCFAPPRFSEFPIAGPPPMADAPRPVRAALGADRPLLVVVEELAVSTTPDPYLSLRALAHYSGCSVRRLRDRLADPHHPPTTGPMARCSSAGATGSPARTLPSGGQAGRGAGRDRGARESCR
jgi:hypothetical protein